MTRYIRVFIAIIVVLSLVILARNNQAWAANPEAQTGQTSLSQADQTVTNGGDDDCDKPGSKYSDKCRDRDGDKCRRKHHNCGTVKPPDDHLETCERGAYSVGGVATIVIRNLRHNACLTADTRSPDPNVDHIPPRAGTILSEVLVVQVPPRTGNIEVCFAVPPGTQVRIYSSSNGSFQVVRTRIKNGIACADIDRSGSYALVGR